MGKVSRRNSFLWIFKTASNSSGGRMTSKISSWVSTTQVLIHWPRMSGNSAFWQAKHTIFLTLDGILCRVNLHTKSLPKPRLCVEGQGGDCWYEGAAQRADAGVGFSSQHRFA